MPHDLLKSLSHSRPKVASGDVHARPGNNRHGKPLMRRDRSTSPLKNANREEDTRVRFEAGMCYLRGVCFAKQNSFDRAKSAYMDAVRLDVQCYEAFDQLMKNSLLTPDEEWEFLESLNFDNITVSSNVDVSQQAASLTKMLYTTRLSKYSRPHEFDNAMDTLSTHYNLSNNPDILLAKAELLFTQCRFKQALNLTSTILSHDEHNLTPLPVHLACLHELNERNALQLLAHNLTDKHPNSPHTWLAVGVYYLTISNIPSARRYFSKSSQMDPHYGPAWIGFAHTFAAEGEHEQAISAYSTAMRLFQGTHLPSLFLGMQYLQNNNFNTAAHFLREAESSCSTDPLLLNEIAAVAYHQDDLARAIRYFDSSLDCADVQGADPRSTLSTRINLGHAHRRAGAAAEHRATQNQNSGEEQALLAKAGSHYETALEQFNEVLRSGGRDAAVFSAKGMVLRSLGRAREAVVALHESLALDPVDGRANDLLALALEDCAEEAGTGGGWWGSVPAEDVGLEESMGVGRAGGSAATAAGAGGFDEADAWVEGRKREVLDGVAAARWKNVVGGGGGGGRARGAGRAESKKGRAMVPPPHPVAGGAGKGKGRANPRQQQQQAPPPVRTNGAVAASRFGADVMETDEEL